MFTSPIFAFIGLTLYILAGMAIGALTGWISSWALKCKPRRIFTDACLGSLGFLIGFIGTILVPYPNTISYRLKGGTQVTSTMGAYQHPERIAVVIAVLLPLFYELYRFRTMQTGNI
jgi:uncharacterized membrane protein YeaQ/YmgE (transglycosylase-associated protein family)